jgi:hypothetical protein
MSHTKHPPEWQNINKEMEETIPWLDRNEEQLEVMYIA